jgi:hypothetical protein
MPKIFYKMVKIRHKFVSNPEENFATKVLIFGVLYKITIVERLLTGKLLTGKLPTGIYSTDKAYPCYYRY